MSRRDELPSLAETWARNADVSPLGNRWQTAADVLGEYGHVDEAEAIRLCAERLRSLLSDTRPEDISSEAGEPGDPGTSPSDSERPSADSPAREATDPQSHPQSSRSEFDRPTGKPDERPSSHWAVADEPGDQEADR